MMRPATGTVPLIVGVGNELRSDDGCGIAVARAVRDRLGPSVEVIELAGEPTAVLDQWAGRDLVYAIDAVRSGGPAGRIVRREVVEGRLPTGPATSTHGLSLAEVVALGCSLDRMPRHLVLYGIEAGEVGTGRGLSAAVERAVSEVAARIGAEIADAARSRGDVRA
jgi:hydrogenase maturation protease